MAKTDSGVYPEPALPVLPAGGGKFTDPTFGTLIMRLTDAADDPAGCSPVYSYWPSANCNMTRVLVNCWSGKPLFYEFDPLTFTRGMKTPYTGNLDFVNGSFWDKSSPDVIYAFKATDTRLYGYNLATGVEVTIKDFASLMDPGDYVLQPSMSDDCTVVGFTRMNRAGETYAPIGYIVYDLKADKVVLSVLDSNINEVHVSKKGDYASADLYASQTPPVDQFDSQAIRKWSLGSPQTAQTLRFYDPIHNPGVEGLSHNTMESDWIVGFTATYSATVSKWALSNLARTLLLDIGWNTVQSHCSALADNEGWVLISPSGKSEGQVGSVPFFNELFLVKTDGSGQVFRFCHPRCIYHNYADCAFANISRDGKWVCFGSSWEGGRKDFFIASIPDSPAASSEPPPTPTPPIFTPTITAPSSVTVPRNGSGVISVTLGNLSQPVTVSVQGSSGQVSVSPLSKLAQPSSSILAFQVKVKQQSRTITFNSPIGSVSVLVRVL